MSETDNQVLVWQAASLAMNPSLNAEEIHQAIEDDEAAGLAEFGAQFRSDIERLFPQAVIEAATVQGRRELPRVAEVRYVAHVDPSGGSSDAMTLCIAHAEGEQISSMRSGSHPAFQPGAGGRGVCEPVAGLWDHVGHRRPLWRGVAA